MYWMPFPEQLYCFKGVCTRKNSTLFMFLYNEDMNVKDAIRTKRAVREFSPEPLPEEAVLAILRAGSRSQSAKNTQPWHFIVLREREMLQKASRLGTWAGHLAGAAAAVVIVSPPFTQKFSIAFDLGQSASYMQLAAWELGIGSCLATIYEIEEARRLLGFPQDLETHVAISFGYPKDQTALTRPPQPGGRRAFDETVHWDHW
jgi:nitroreductase